MNVGYLLSESTPLRILFVEDNETNLFYYKIQLSGFKDTIDFAEDGQQAVSKAAATVYDVIFMDIYLPVLNGYQAAKKIKELPPPHCDVPIIGMTNALNPEETSSPDIHEYIVKFFKVDELQVKLKQIIKKKLPKEPVPLPEESPIQKIKDPEAKQKMIQLFKKHREEFVEQMQRLLPQNKQEDILFHVHKMKSTIELLGIPSLKILIEKMEHDSKENNLESVRSDFELLKRSLQEYY